MHRVDLNPVVFRGGVGWWLGGGLVLGEPALALYPQR